MKPLQDEVPVNSETFLAFKEKYDALNKTFIDNFKTEFANFRTRLESQIGSLDQLNITQALDFNIFSILPIARLEVLTHSPFLAELLNPKGVHGQGNLFLSCFLSLLLGFPEDECQDSNWRVFTEVNHIDIKLWNGVLKKAVYIENKVDTDAHSGQLTRYYKDWVDGQAKGKGAFVFLTASEFPPSDFGFDHNASPRYAKTQILKDLTLLSYQSDIAGWLEACLPQVQAPRVQYTVEQYLDLIKSL